MHLDQLKRREFITLLGGAAAAWPLAARAQQPDRMRRIGVLMSVPENDPEAQAWLGAFSEGLQQLGWTAGRNIRLDYRWAASFDAESRQRVGKELVALQPCSAGPANIQEALRSAQLRPIYQKIVTGAKSIQ